MPNKYMNVKTTLDGVQFDSRKEAARYQELLLLLRAGQIANLKIHPKYPLRVNGKHVGYYYGDFQYDEVSTGKPILEDVKSVATRKLACYRLKKRLVLAIYGLDITEV